jgi:hypothetical protein
MTIPFKCTIPRILSANSIGNFPNTNYFGRSGLFMCIRFSLFKLLCSAVCTLSPHNNVDSVLKQAHVMLIKPFHCGLNGERWTQNF